MNSSPTQTTGVPRVVVVDVETSGLSARRHRILQIAAVELDPSGAIVNEWSSHVRPRFRRVGPTHIHGLTAASLRSSPVFNAIATDLAKRLDGALVVGHNIDFDWDFITRSLKRSRVSFEPAARLCTLDLSRSLDPERALRHRLAEVCARNDVELSGAHDALNDARATALVLSHLLAQAGLALGDVSTHRAYRASTVSSRRRRKKRGLPWFRQRPNKAPDRVLNTQTSGSQQLFGSLPDGSDQR